MAADKHLVLCFAVLVCIASARAESNACAEPALNCSSNSSQPADCATAATAAAKYAISLSSQHYTPREYINGKAAAADDRCVA